MPRALLAFRKVAGRMDSGHGKFDEERARAYAEQARIALAGYDACQELGACMLSSAIGSGEKASVLVAGAGGTGSDLVTIARLEPGWSFTAIDPSPEMLALARDAYRAEEILDRVTVVQGMVHQLGPTRLFDAAVLVGVLHHVPSKEEKTSLLADIARLLSEGAPLLIAGNRGEYRGNPHFLAAWQERWRQRGFDSGEGHARMQTILKGAVPPASAEEIETLLRFAGFEKPSLYFSSLFWGAWFTRKAKT